MKRIPIKKDAGGLKRLMPKPKSRTVANLRQWAEGTHAKRK